MKKTRDDFLADDSALSKKTRPTRARKHGREVSRREQGRTRESQREDRDTNNERCVKSKLRGRMGWGMADGQSMANQLRSFFLRERAPGWP
jgi:hypothetical protein